MSSVADEVLAKIRASYQTPKYQGEARIVKPVKRPHLIVDLDGETWTEIEGYPNYQISDYGRIKSVARSIPRLLKPFTSRYGNNIYLRVTLCNNNIRKDIFVHRLVIEAFQGEFDGVVWFKDRDSMNVTLDNLEVISLAEQNRRVKTK